MYFEIGVMQLQEYSCIQQVIYFKNSKIKTKRKEKETDKGKLHRIKQNPKRNKVFPNNKIENGKEKHRESRKGNILKIKTKKTINQKINLTTKEH